MQENGTLLTQPGLKMVLSSLIFPNLSRTTLMFTFLYKWMFFVLYLNNMQLVLTGLFYNIMTDKGQWSQLQ